ncbi:unnamed protein product [Phaedon cochleariae]|uniref:5'-nucleotidase n=1 Tax=Phaedon cochleariae TaxID=80249 RepID=A0A9N9WZP8_PHACE|nr:unnamed protein product [Phaedon cochleariae]
MPISATVAVALVLLTTLSLVGCDLDLVILHNNDVHGRFEETEKNSGSCRDNNRNSTCIGGFARTAHEVRKYRELAQKKQGPEVLFLNAGDTFVGTIWYSLFQSNISYEFWNLLKPDAMCLGNHEFDNGVSGLLPFVSALKFPVLAANLNFSQVPELAPYVDKSTIVERGGRKIGIIGLLTPETKLISNPGKVIFLDEVESAKAESERLDALGIKIIIVLGHSGFLKDQEIAAKAPLVDAVVGGHTNTFLWNGPPPDTEAVDGPYPVVVTQESGKKVPVVQAYAYTKYLGRLNLTFDDNGDLVKFSGQPELMVASIPQEEDVLRLLETYRPEVDKVNTEIIGRSKVTLDGDSKLCRSNECNFGNLLTDALVAYKASISPKLWTEAPIGLYNGGGIRNTIEPVGSNDVTRGEILAAIPFGNQILTLKLNGSDLLETLEIGARTNGETSGGEFLQVSGLRVVYDMSKPAFSRVVSVEARCGLCPVPVYQPIDPLKTYTIVTISFLTQGGDDHHILRDRGFDEVVEDLDDIDTVVWYFQHYNPVYPEVQGRIRFVERSTSGGASLVVGPLGAGLLLFLFVFYHL